MLFYLDRQNKIALHKDAYKVNPSFRKLTDDQMRYVILLTDYSSQFNQYPESERKQKSRGWVFGKGAENPEGDPKVRQAIIDYDNLQYDENRQLYRVYQKKMTSYQILYQNEADPQKSDKYLISIQNLQKAMNILHREIMTNVQANYVLKGKLKMSFLEHLRANKKLAAMRSEQEEKLEGIHIKNEMPTNNNSKRENLIG
jgi:hypothetical protein